MGSIHYPTLSSSSKLPLQTHGNRSTSPSKHGGGVRSGFSAHPLDNSGGKPTPSKMSTENTDKRSKRRPGSFPVIPNAHDLDPRVTSTKSRHSMAEVVARMRVREKTLLGEDLLKRRATQTHNGERKPTNHRPVPLINLEGTVRWDAEPSSHTSAQWMSSQGAFAPHTRTRKNGVVAIHNAWGTPRDPAEVGALHVNGTSAHQDSVSWNGVHVTPGAVNGWHHHQHHENDVTDDVDVPVEQNMVVDGAGSDDDDDFDFDEGEDEVEAERTAGRLSQATLAVYQRACGTLRVQPSPAFLRQCNVTSMDLRDVRLGPVDVKPIAIALVRDTKIVFLDLSNNDLGPIGVSYIAEMLQENTTLMDLNLSATNPGREGVKALSETLRHNRTLAYLRLEENRIEHTESYLLADIIKSVPSLLGLFLGHNKLGYYGGAAIASAMAQNRTLLTLDLHWNHIRRDSAVALARAIAINNTLRKLNLAWNGLGKEGCLALAHALPKNTSLVELDLTCNRVDLMSLGFLLKGVTRNRRLHTLKIGQNPLTTEGAKALVSAVTSAPDVEITQIDITGVPVDLEFTQMVSRAQESRVLHVKHEEAITLATSDRKREHDGTNLDRYDPVMVLFEYMKIDNLRVIDMFQFMDVKKRDKLSKSDIREGLNTMKLPVTEHAIDVIHQKLDLNKDGFVELDEMMKVQRDTARQVKLRQIKAKSKNREDEGLNGLHKIIRDIITKRKEDNQGQAAKTSSENRRDSQSVTKTSGDNRRDSQSITKTSGGRKASVGGLQLTQARYSVTSSKRRGDAEQQQLASIQDDEQ